MVNKRLVARYALPVVMTYTLTIGAIPALVLSLPALPSQDWSQVTRLGWSTLAWSVVIAVYLAWTLWNWVIARLGVARTAVFLYLVPLIGGLASWLLLGEGFGIAKLAGALLTLSGLTLARHAVKPQVTAMSEEDPRCDVAPRTAEHTRMQHGQPVGAAR